MEMWTRNAVVGEAILIGEWYFELVNASTENANAVRRLFLVSTDEPFCAKAYFGLYGVPE